MEDRLKLYTPREVRNFSKTTRRIFGAPAPMPHPRAKIPSNNHGKLKGVLTEHAIASMLGLLTFHYEDLYVFHSLGNFDGGDGETDNIVIYQDKLIFIEVKSLTHFDSVSIDQQGDFYGKCRGEKILLGSNNNMVQKLETIRTMFPHVTPHGMFVVGRAEKTGSSYSGLTVTTTVKLMDDVMSLLYSAQPPIYPVLPLLQQTMGLCIRYDEIPLF